MKGIIRMSLRLKICLYFSSASLSHLLTGSPHSSVIHAHLLSVSVYLMAA